MPFSKNFVPLQSNLYRIITKTFKTMKKLFYCLTAVALVAGLASCDKKDKEVSDDTNKVTGNFFKIEVSDETSDGAYVVTTPQDTTTSYYCDVITKADFDLYESDAAYVEDIIAYYNERIEYYAALGYDITLAEMLEGSLYTGVDEYEYTFLESSTDYYAVAVRIAEDGSMVGSVEKQLFHTGDVTPSEIKFEFSIDTVTVDSINLIITPSNNDQYLTYLFSESELSDYDSEEDALRDYESYYESWGYTLLGTGETYFTLNNWVEESGKQILLVAGYDGGFTTAVTRYEFNFDVADEDDDDDDASYVAPKSIRKAAVNHKKAALRIKK